MSNTKCQDPHDPIQADYRKLFPLDHMLWHVQSQWTPMYHLQVHIYNLTTPTYPFLEMNSLSHFLPHLIYCFLLHKHLPSRNHKIISFNYFPYHHQNCMFFIHYPNSFPSSYPHCHHQWIPKMQAWTHK